MQNDKVLQNALAALARQREIERLTSPSMPEYEPGYLDAWVKDAERYFEEHDQWTSAQ